MPQGKEVGAAAEAQIFHLYHQGASCVDIARELGLCRDTIKKYVKKLQSERVFGAPTMTVNQGSSWSTAPYFIQPGACGAVTSGVHPSLPPMVATSSPWSFPAPPVPAAWPGLVQTGGGPSVTMVPNLLPQTEKSSDIELQSECVTSNEQTAVSPRSPAPSLGRQCVPWMQSQAQLSCLYGRRAGLPSSSTAEQSPASAALPPCLGVWRAEGPGELGGGPMRENFSFGVDADYVRRSPPTSVLAAAVGADDGHGIVHLITTTVEPQGAGPGLRLLGNAHPDMHASCEAVHAWVRLNMEAICRRYCLARDGGAETYRRYARGLPPVKISVRPLLEKANGSMGAGFGVSLIAALLGRQVRHDVSVTGGVSMRGDLGDVGSLGAKARALGRVGVTELLVGEATEDENLGRTGVRRVDCASMWDVLDRCFLPDTTRRRSRHDPEPPPVVPVLEREVGYLGWSLGIDRDLRKVKVAGLREGAAELELEVPHPTLLQCALFMTANPSAASVASAPPYRITGRPSRCMSEVVESAFDAVMRHVEAWGALRVPWPPASESRAELVFHVSPVEVPRNPDPRPFALCFAMALISVLTGRRPVPGVVLIGELSGEGQVLPLRQLNGAREVRWLETLRAVWRVDMHTLVLPESGYGVMLRALAQSADRCLQRLSVVGVRNLEDAVGHALEPAR